MSSTPYDQRLAAIVARAIRNLPVTPNQVTVFGLILGLTGALLFGHGGTPWTWLGGALFILACFMDHVDGELARLTHTTSRFGHYLDRACAASVYVTIFVGIGWGQSSGWLGNWSVMLGLAAGAAIGFIFAVRNLVEQHAGHAAIRQPAFAGFEIEDTLYLIGPMAWLGFLEPLVLAAGTGAPVYLLITLARARHQRA